MLTDPIMRAYFAGMQRVQMALMGQALKAASEFMEANAKAKADGCRAEMQRRQFEACRMSDQ